MPNYIIITILFYLGLTLQKKWKSLRDNYVREAKKCKMVKSGSGRSNKSTYLHSERLRFLQGSVENNVTESSFSTDDENVKITNNSNNVNDVDDNFKSPKEDCRKNKKKIKLHPADEHFANILEKSMAQRYVPEKKDEDDEDKLFCLSLVKEIKKVPEDKRLKLKIDMYNLILQNQTSSSDGYQHAMYRQQYRPSNFGYPNYGYNSTPHNTTTQGYHYDHNFADKSNQLNTSSPAPSPTPTNVSETDSAQSILDLFD